MLIGHVTLLNLSYMFGLHFPFNFLVFRCFAYTNIGVIRNILCQLHLHAGIPVVEIEPALVGIMG